jgi:hypothetical protein
MATLQDIADLLGNEGDLLRAKVQSAVLLRMNEIMAEVDDATEAMRRRKRFAQSFYAQTSRTPIKYQAGFERVYRAVVTQNAGFTKAQILNANDAALKTATDTAIAFFVANFPDPVEVP